MRSRGILKILTVLSLAGGIAGAGIPIANSYYCPRSRRFTIRIEEEL